MAVYFDTKIEPAVSGSNNYFIQWHIGGRLLAVGSYHAERGGAVTLYSYLDEATHLSDTVLQNPSPPSSLAWHPAKRLLAVGWQSGDLTTWSEESNQQAQLSGVHRGAVGVLRWNPGGTRMLSGDNTGTLAVWKADPRGELVQPPIATHELNETLNQCVFKPVPPIDPATDLAMLAKAAVSGDEKALDMFTWNKTSTFKMNSGPTESLCCYVSGTSGGIYYVNEAGESTLMYTAEEPVKRLLYYEDKSILVVITSSFMLSQYSVNDEGSLVELSKVKLSGRPQEADIIWVGKGVLATATGENIVRLWDLENSENFVLGLQGQAGFQPSENVICIAYSKQKGVLAGGTSLGNVVLWKHQHIRTEHREEEWKLQAPAPLEGIIKHVTWGSNNLLGICTVHCAYVLEEHSMVTHYCGEVAAVQISPVSIWLEVFSLGTCYQLKTEIQVKGVWVTRDNLAAWNGKRVLVYDISTDHLAVKLIGSFASGSSDVAMSQQSLYLIEQGKVQVRTFQGTVKQSLTFSESEGEPCCLDVNATYLIVGTTASVLKVWDLSRREARLHMNPKSLKDLVPFYEKLQSVRVNCKGSRVSIHLKTEAETPVYILYIWDVESDSIQYFNFNTGRGDQEDYKHTETDDVTNADRASMEAARYVAGRYPLSHYWDATEAKLLVCEAHLLPGSGVAAAAGAGVAAGQQDGSQLSSHVSVATAPSSSSVATTTKMLQDNAAQAMVVSLFATQESGVIVQDSLPLPDAYACLLGVDIPYYYYVQKSDHPSEGVPTYDPQAMSTSEMMIAGGGGGGGVTSPVQHLAARAIMRDFAGLEGGDERTRAAMMNFSYYLAVGNMDEAYKAIKLIKSESVWENMARMCVKSRRLDVAAVCLGNMGHARGAKQLRAAMKEPELDAAVAMLAVQLGMLDEAERLYINCHRYDLLNRFYQARGMWEKAMEIAEVYDRLHLRSTYYNYGKYLESRGDFSSAILQYEKSGTSKFEVPRMLFDESPADLERYIMQTKDTHLHKWWAQYMESLGEMETAMQFYEAARDWLSLVRVYCYCGNIVKASEIANETGDRAACYHLARQYENQENIKEAIHFFTRAHAYGNAIRICKEHALDDQLVNLALYSSPEDMIGAARYYEKKPQHKDKAVMLYHKAGYLTRAVDMAFKSHQTSALHLISGDLQDSTDPELVSKMAQFFVDNGQYDKAVDLLIKGKKYFDALDLCVEYNIQISEELAERFTLDKRASDGGGGGGGGGEDAATRVRLLEKIADCAMQQRSYHLATKKYTQAGNKVKAMRALLKSGDTEKIVFFANVSRQRDIYVMAANYLQTLDWKKDPAVMKHIIAFYTKGRSLDSLARFYESCAQVEIDEYQNYEKALGAFGEAQKCLAKATMENQSEKEDRIARVKRKIDLVKKFVQARRTYETNQGEGIKQFQALGEEENVEDGVRVGDIYGFLAEHYVRIENWKLAYSCLEQMRSRMPGVNLTYYVNVKTVERIHQALDIPLHKNLIVDDGEEDGEEVEEEVEEYNV